MSVVFSHWVLCHQAMDSVAVRKYICEPRGNTMFRCRPTLWKKFECSSTWKAITVYRWFKRFLRLFIFCGVVFCVARYLLTWCISSRWWSQYACWSAVHDDVCTLFAWHSAPLVAYRRGMQSRTTKLYWTQFLRFLKGSSVTVLTLWGLLPGYFLLVAYRRIAQTQHPDCSHFKNEHRRCIPVAVGMWRATILGNIGHSHMRLRYTPCLGIHTPRTLGISIVIYSLSGILHHSDSLANELVIHVQC